MIDAHGWHERELIGRNVAAGRRRCVPVRHSQRSYLDAAWQIEALLAGAGSLDVAARAANRHPHVERWAMVATLVFAGLRIGELLDLRWRDIDLATGRLTVRQPKTAAGVRHVTMRPALLDELASANARAAHDGPGNYVRDENRPPPVRGQRARTDRGEGDRAGEHGARGR